MMNRLELWELRWRLRGDRDMFWVWSRCPKCHRAYGGRLTDYEYATIIRCDWDGTWWTASKGH